MIFLCSGIACSLDICIQVGMVFNHVLDWILERAERVAFFDFHPRSIEFSNKKSFPGKSQWVSCLTCRSWPIPTPKRRSSNWNSRCKLPALIECIVSTKFVRSICQLMPTIEHWQRPVGSHLEIQNGKNVDELNITFLCVRGIAFKKQST